MRHRFAVAGVLLLAAHPIPAPTPIRVAAAARAIQPGELVVLTMTSVEPIDALKVHAFNHDIGAFRVAPDTWRALVGIDLDVAPGTHVVSIEASSAGLTIATTYPLRVRSRVFPTRSLS